MFEDRTYETIKRDILNNCDTDIAKNEGSFLNDFVSATSISHATFYTILETIFKVSFIADSYGDSLDKRVSEFGYERKEGQFATGYIKVAGEDGAIIRQMDEFFYLDKKYYCVNEDATTNIQDGVATIKIQASERGTEYNLPYSAILTSDVLGVEMATNYTPIYLGTEDETDEELKARFFYVQKNKGTSGNIDDYKRWGLEIEEVKNVKVIPLWNGNGTVKVVLLSENNKNVSEDVLEKAQEYIDSKRPIGATVTVTTPSVLLISIDVVVEISDTTDLSQIESEIRMRLDEYLVNADKEITYTKVAGIIISIDGVIDYKDLKINGLTANIKLETDQIGNVGDIKVEKGEVE